MKIAILGFARDGQAAYEHWDKPDNQITICDQDPSIQIPSGAASQLGSDYLKNLDQFDLLVRSAGLPPAKIAQANPEAPHILQKVTGNIDEFYHCSPSRNIIGVTGTKGKGTTCTLITKFLEAAGKTVHLGGNIGIPALELLKNNIQPSDWVVLEQSSFQLIDQQHAPHIAVCLMIQPEHLNWHQDLQEYLGAKQRLFSQQTKNDIAIYYAANQNSQKLASTSPGRLIPYMQEPGARVANGQIIMDGQPVCSVNKIKLLGEHNLQNICAAITAFWQISQDVTAIRKVLETFAGLPHHLELVGTKNDIGFYDDSFGTIPETAIVAIQALEQPKILILGGSDKKSDFTELAQTIAGSNVKAAVLIGDTAPIIKECLEKAGFHNTHDGGKTMASIVAKAASLAEPGDVVLLSPACASFGLFNDYKDRGQQFNQTVKDLL